MSEYSFIAENYKIITDKLGEAMLKSGRSDAVRLMAVTKTRSADLVNFAVSLGIGLLGENRVQEFLQKYENYSKKCEINFIGGLQNNKVKYIINKVDMIHSVDSVKLAGEINRQAEKHGRVMDVLVEVNIGREPGKNGISPEEADELCDVVSGLSCLRLRGLMAIPPAGSGVERYFADMQRMFTDRKKHEHFDTLSMGMSNDYALAVKYGSTIVRIGSALFGERK